MDEKKCIGCKKIKHLTMFRFDGKSKDGRRNRCLDCTRKQSKKYYKKNQEVVKRNNRARQLVSKYWPNLTPQQALNRFNRMIQDQGGKCAICLTAFKDTKDTHVDHCHATNEVRGVLCANCNKALGLFKDSLSNVQSAALYLLNHANRGVDKLPTL